MKPLFKMKVKGDMVENDHEVNSSKCEKYNEIVGPSIIESEKRRANELMTVKVERLAISTPVRFENEDDVLLKQKPEALLVNPKFRSESIKVEPEPHSLIQNHGIKIENDVESGGNFGHNVVTNEVAAVKSEQSNPDLIEKRDIDFHEAATMGKFDNGDPHSARWVPEVLYLKSETPASENSSHSKPFRKMVDELDASNSDDSAESSKDTNWKVEDITNGEELVKNIKKLVSMNAKANVVDSPSAQRYLRRRTCPNTKIEPDEFFNEILKDVALSEEQSETIRELRSGIDFSKTETITFTDGFKFHLCLVCGYQTHVPAAMTIHVRIHTGEKPFACDECVYRCTTSQALRVHKRTHTGEKPYGCTFCSYRTRSSNQLKLHTLAHEGKKPHKCSTCDFRCRDPKILKQHIRRHTGEKPYACPLCDYRCSKDGSLTLHMRTHSGEKPYKCSFCDYASSCGSSLAIHIRIHTGEKPFSCEFCPYKSVSTSRMTTHTRTHTGDKPFKCTFCSYRSATHSRITSHIRTHTGEKAHACAHCDYRAARTDNLKVHLLTHTGEKPFACHLCDYRASENAQMKSHIRRHTGERPYACKVCGFRAIDSSSLKKHEKVHSSDKPLKCDFCDYRTGRPGVLKAHIMRHTGDKPYGCPHCPYRAIKSNNVKGHVRSRHRVTSPHGPKLEEFLCAVCAFHTSSREVMKSHALRHIA